MQISEQFKAFDAPTLVVVSDKSKARFFRGEEREFEFLAEIGNDRLKLDDERNQVATADNKFSKQSDEMFGSREGANFYRIVTDEINQNIASGSFEKLILVVPHEDKNALVDGLDGEAKKRLERVVPKQLTKLSTEDLLESLDAARNE